MINLQGIPAPLARVMEMLAALPGIGPKTAMRLSMHLLEKPAEDLEQLSHALSDLHHSMGFCKQCGCFAEKGYCRNCEQAHQNGDMVCVVEQPVDVLMLERCGGFAGRYHVLHGRLSPVDGMGPEQLWLDPLDTMVESGHVRELVLATSATVDGEATAHFLARRYGNTDVRVSRIARGIPEGGELEYLDEHTLNRALHQRVYWEQQV